MPLCYPTRYHTTDLSYRHATATTLNGTDCARLPNLNDNQLRPGEGLRQWGVLGLGAGTSPFLCGSVKTKFPIRPNYFQIIRPCLLLKPLLLRNPLNQLQSPRILLHYIHYLASTEREENEQNRRFRLRSYPIPCGLWTLQVRNYT